MEEGEDRKEEGMQDAGVLKTDGGVNQLVFFPPSVSLKTGYIRGRCGGMLS